MPGPAAVDAVMGAHHEAWPELLGRATGRDPEWLGRLSDDDGSALSMAMREANGPFLVRLAAAALARRKNCGGPFRSLASSALVRDGHGTGRADLAERLTWRQIELFWRVRGTEE